MAVNKKITECTELTTAPAGDDALPIVDISDTTDAVSGTTKFIEWVNLILHLFGSRFAADAGANDTYVATLVPAPAAYVTGEHYRFKANTANTGACTINFNGLGAKAIKKAAGGVTTDLDTNDIRAGQWVDLVYDGTNMQMQSILGNAPSAGGYTTIEEEGTPLTARTTLNFVGGGVTAADGGSKTIVTIPGGGAAADPLGHHQQVQVLSNSGAITTFGAAAAGINGTNANGEDADGPWAQYTSATSLNADAGVFSNGGSFNHVETRFTPIFYAKIKTGGTVTELRTLIGLCSEAPMGSDTPPGHLLFFRFSTVAADTNWQCLSDDGGAAPTITDSGVAHTANTEYAFKIDCSDPASIKFYINGVLVATHTTNLPTTSQDLGWHAQVRNTGATNAKVIKLNRMVISMP